MTTDETIALMTKFLSEHIGMYVTDLRGVKIDTQKEWYDFLEKEGLL